MSPKTAVVISNFVDKMNWRHLYWFPPRRSLRKAKEQSGGGCNSERSSNHENLGPGSNNLTLFSHDCYASALLCLQKMGTRIRIIRICICATSRLSTISGGYRKNASEVMFKLFLSWMFHHRALLVCYYAQQKRAEGGGRKNKNIPSRATCPLL